MIIRARTFKGWLTSQFYRGELRDIADYGADTGYPKLTWTSDCVKLFDKFGDEIWDLAYKEAQKFGCRSVPELISQFRRADMADSLDGFKNLMVWFAAETYARELTDA